MCEESDCYCLCPLEGIIDTIAKKWALLIINALGNHPRLRFNQILQELGGVSPKTLADTLKVLQQEGLIGRDSFAEIPPRVEYYLTKDGRELRTAIIPLLTWASQRETFRNHCTIPCERKQKKFPKTDH